MVMFWVDIETTGLDSSERGDIILEVGSVVTDNDLNILDEKSWLVGPPSSIIEQTISLTPLVQKMHTDSGLFRALDDKHREFKHVAATDAGNVRFLQQKFMVEFQNFFYTYSHFQKHPLCGSSVHFDRAFLERDFPEIKGLFSYRNIDVSSFKEYIGLIRDISDRPTGNKKHRVIDDCKDSIDELRWYRDNFLENQ